MRFLLLSLNRFIHPMSSASDEPRYTSDAQTSNDSIRLSQYQWQPANIWFKNTTLLHPNDEQDTETQASTNEEENVKAKRKRKDVISSNKSLTPFSNVQARDKKFHTIPQGRGTVIAVIDSGINARHKAFAKPGKIIDAVNFARDGYDCQDEIGHGTECAGIACGLPFKLRIQGKMHEYKSAAPKAKLMILKVADENGYIYNTSICKAIEYIIRHNSKPGKEKVDVISLSLGSSEFDAELAKKIQHAITNNIIVVSAASNQGASIINPIAYPSKLGHVICVGACNRNGKPTDFTPEGREIDCLELGENVLAPTIDGERSVKLCHGTSYSTPIVAACICLIIEDIRNLADAYNIPDLLEKLHNVWCMREILKMMAVKQGHHDRERGYGRLDPTLFFEKTPEEKLRILQNIYCKGSGMQDY